MRSKQHGGHPLEGSCQEIHVPCVPLFVALFGSVSKVEMFTPMPLIYADMAQGRKVGTRRDDPHG